MGAQNQVPNKPNPVNPSHWQPVKTLAASRERKDLHYMSLRNKFTGMVIDQYELEFQNEGELRLYRQVCLQRARDGAVVPVLYFWQDGAGEFCGTGYRAKVYIENMSTRLRNIKAVPLPEAIYLLFTACQGFHRLYQQKGYFQIKQNHFCFTKAGELKVWMNSNLSRNEPEDPATGQPYKQTSQQAMVSRILQLLNPKFPPDQKTQTFQQYLDRKNSPSTLSFTNLQKALRSYSNQLKISIPSKCQSLSTVHDHSRTNLSARGNRARGNGQRDRAFLRKGQVQVVEVNQELNYSIEESNMVKVIWEERNASLQKPIDSAQKPNDRITTLVDDLLSEASSPQNCKPFTPVPTRISYFDPIIEQVHYPMYIPVIVPIRNPIPQPESPKLLQKTAASTPRGHNYSAVYSSKCKYNTVESSFQIDPLIAQDLLKYL